MKIKELSYFTDNILKIMEIGRKIGSAVHANLAGRGGVVTAFPPTRDKIGAA
jgi:hypothetical protein